MIQQKKNGCHDRQPYRETLQVQNGWIDGRRNMETIPFVMSKGCHYTNTEAGKVDPGCTGCRWKQ